MLVIRTHSTHSNVQDQTFSVQNQHQKYPTIRDQDGKLAGWDLPHNHLETNISNFFRPHPEEVPEVKYPQSYQAMFGGTLRTVHMNKDGVEFVYFNHRGKAFERVKISPAHAHMVIPIERKAPFQPQNLAQQPTQGMPVQTTPLQQSTSMQPVLTPANTVAHTRSLPQQPINQGVVGDADMATMLMSIRGALIGEDGVQQGFPSQEGGPRLIRFESPRWRPKAIQVRAQFGVQE
jgi:hypothetical protein